MAKEPSVNLAGLLDQLDRMMSLIAQNLEREQRNSERLKSLEVDVQAARSVLNKTREDLVATRQAFTSAIQERDRLRIEVEQCRADQRSFMATSAAAMKALETINSRPPARKPQPKLKRKR